MILNKFLKYLNQCLTGTNIPNELVTVKVRVKLPDENRIVSLKVIGFSPEINEILKETRKKMSGMYPPTHEAALYIDCETEK